MPATFAARSPFRSVARLLDDDRGVVGQLELSDDVLADVEAVVGHDDELAVLVVSAGGGEQGYEHDDGGR